jgi:hypothetical protein
LLGLQPHKKEEHIVTVSKHLSEVFRECLLHVTFGAT